MNLVHALRRGSSACGGSGPATSTWINAGCPECSRALGDPWPALHDRRWQLEQSTGRRLELLLAGEWARPPAEGLAVLSPKLGWRITRRGLAEVAAYREVWAALGAEADAAQRPVLRATWTPGEGWRWTCGTEEGRFDARSPSAGVAVDQFRRLLQRWPDGVELEVDGLDEVEHRTLAYLLRFNVGGDDL